MNNEGYLFCFCIFFSSENIVMYVRCKREVFNQERVREGFKNPSYGKIPLRGRGEYPPFPLTFFR